MLKKAPNKVYARQEVYGQYPGYPKYSGEEHQGHLEPVRDMSVGKGEAMK